MVVSIDPLRVYVDAETREEAQKKSRHHVVEMDRVGPNGERFAWYQCTVKGGRERRDIDSIQLVEYGASGYERVVSAVTG